MPPRSRPANGTIDAIVTDHGHTDWEQDREFELAPFGMTGLETSLSLVLTRLVRASVIDCGPWLPPSLRVRSCARSR